MPHWCPGTLVSLGYTENAWKVQTRNPPWRGFQTTSFERLENEWVKGSNPLSCVKARLAQRLEHFTLVTTYLLWGSTPPLLLVERPLFVLGVGC